MHIYGSDLNEFRRVGVHAYDWYNAAPTDQHLRNENRVRKYLQNMGLPLLFH